MMVSVRPTVVTHGASAPGEAFIAAYRDCPAGARIDLTLAAHARTNQTWVHCAIDGAAFVFTPAAARTMADVFETAIRSFPGHPTTEDMADIVVALRATADRAEKQDIANLVSSPDGSRQEAAKPRA